MLNLDGTEEGWPEGGKSPDAPSTLQMEYVPGSVIMPSYPENRSRNSKGGPFAHRIEFTIRIT
jgi:hypothetical protein